MTITVARPVDLRDPVWARSVLAEAARALETTVDPSTAVAKRRSLGALSARGTWVRVEARPLSRVRAGHHGDRVETSRALDGVARPRWRRGASWRDAEVAMLWRVDETDAVAATPIKPGGTLTSEPVLAQSWWRTLNASLDALAAHRPRDPRWLGELPAATLEGAALTQERISRTLHDVFPQLRDTSINEWCAVHADLNWANLTAPECWILDWEDWGSGPRGFDAATLWVASLATPRLAARVRRERAADLASREGTLSALFLCAQLIAAGDDYAGPLARPVAAQAQRLLAALQPDAAGGVKVLSRAR
ncbi:hypothetical protein K1T35_48495 (plasmid) [Pseudonocardia sp. DSM 110487]|uniref:phosphotransferase n=1 Tax=Pseudonocardia sp. DSM 110487 TaxID=2865833 RepID=UPI001C6A29F8|nr:phosphotransferase [Pseudonocardia sp. DSM 110487]QYN41188.1 hypothetical protein K1T35_48495 [Pseudonocardia sp. DSM 110487]